MAKNMLQNVVEFIFKYIWIACIVLIVTEFASSLYTGVLLMKQSADGVRQAVSGEISGRVDGVLRLLEGLAQDERIGDVSAPLFDRAVLARPYRDSYGLFMIAVCDRNANVVSTNETNPHAELTSLAYRDYMQRLYKTGTYQITDAFPAGSDGVTMNYTIAVPIEKHDQVQGCVFGSIYFTDIEQILLRSVRNTARIFILYGSENTVMAGNSGIPYGTPFDEIAERTQYFGTTAQEVKTSFSAGKSGSYWEWKKGLYYVTYGRVAPSHWTLACHIPFFSVISTLFPAFIFKLAFYIALTILVSVFGRRYVRRHLAAVNHLLERITVMQRDIFHSEQPDYDNLLEMTQTGLQDQLTGLATRAVLLKKMTLFMAGNGSGLLLFTDLDDLKFINDTYGHEGGDCALIHFARVLKKYEQDYGGVAARYGGDEFVLLLTDLSERESRTVAAALCADLRTTLSVKDHKFNIHGSIGCALYPKDGKTPEELVSRADMALYAAKQGGKDACAFFGDEHWRA